MQTISVQELHDRIASGENIKLVDVREPMENAEFNIGGWLIPLGKIQNMETDEIDGFKDEELVLYCRSGNRSGQACMILESMGFTQVKNLQGGMLSWQNQYPV